MAISPSHIPPDGSVVTSLDSILRERCSKCGRFLPRSRRRASAKEPYQYVEDAEVATARLLSGRRSRSRSSSRSRRSRKSSSSKRSGKRTSRRKSSKRSRRRFKRSSPKSVRFSRGSIPITTLHRRRKRKSRRSKVSLSSKSMQRRFVRYSNDSEEKRPRSYAKWTAPTRTTSTNHTLIISVVLVGGVYVQKLRGIFEV